MRVDHGSEREYRIGPVVVRGQKLLVSLSEHANHSPQELQRPVGGVGGHPPCSLGEVVDDVREASFVGSDVGVAVVVELQHPIENAFGATSSLGCACAGPLLDDGVEGKGVGADWELVIFDTIHGSGRRAFVVVNHLRKGNQSVSISKNKQREHNQKVSRTKCINSTTHRKQHVLRLGYPPIISMRIDDGIKRPYVRFHPLEPPLRPLRHVTQNLRTPLPRHGPVPAPTPTRAHHGVVKHVGRFVDLAVKVEGFHAAHDRVGGEGGVEPSVGDALVAVEDAGEGVGVRAVGVGEHPREDGFGGASGVERIEFLIVLLVVLLVLVLVVIADNTTAIAVFFGRESMTGVECNAVRFLG
mmetsp:Transcript_30613/g.64109  ORF Transcript_30613/g.64109 Transcript_30613/m.64109 type:complete len:356 (-) Transcript_30613:76-1143(-)